MINYQEIIEQLKDEDVFHLLEQLGAQPIDKGGYFLCKTVCHNEDADEASAKLYYYKDTHLFMCYTECGGQSIFKFLRNYYETRNQVYDWYNDIFQVVCNCSAFTAREHEIQGYKSKRENYITKDQDYKFQTYSKGLLDIFVKYYPIEWIQDHIAPDTMDRYDIRYSISQNKIIIPHFDVNGVMIGIRGRALNTQEIETYGKYMPVQIEGKWYSHPLSLNLYGLNLNKDKIRSQGICYICESEKAVMQAESFKIPNCVVAACGSNISKFQVMLLLKHCAPREIVVCFDNEEKPGATAYFNKLWKMCQKYKQYCKFSFIYDRSGLTDLKDSPTDRGEDIFLELLKRRVVVN